jgi:hypothetical protein
VFLISRLGGKTNGEEGNGYGKKVKKAVNCLRQNAQAAGNDSHRHLEHYQDDDDYYGEPSRTAFAGKHYLFLLLGFHL